MIMGMTTTKETLRDELAEIIEREEYYYDTGSHYELSAAKAADGILAAGYRKLRVITTVEELSRLPHGSVIIDARADSCERINRFWCYPVDATGYEDSAITLPATVLWEPEAGAAA